MPEDNGKPIATAKPRNRITRKRKPKARHVAIVGTAPSSMFLAPYDDPDCEIWGVNAFHTFVQPGGQVRWDRIYSMHPVELEKKMAGGVHWKWMTKKQGKPIYMLDKVPEIPDSIAYPIDEVMSHFGPDGDWGPRPYITNSITYMLLHALLEGVEQVGLYGVDMACNTEYGGDEFGPVAGGLDAQRGSCEYVVGLMIGAGVKFHLPDASDLLQHRGLYGYAYNAPLTAKLTAYRQDVQTKHQQQLQARDIAHVNVAKMEGALETIQWVTNSLGIK